MIQRLPQPFNDYNDTESYNPPKTHEPRRRIGLQRGSLYDGTAESPYFKRFSGIEKAHRNSIKITVDLWWSRGESNPCPKATWKELLRVQFVIYIPSSEREQTPYRIW